jgi:uncharacterized surface protein with fasciclin (FAS1) repeats
MNLRKLPLALASLVLVATATTSAHANPASPTSLTQGRNLLEAVRQSKRFDRLTMLLEKAGLTSTLLTPGRNERGFTLFAPTDEAFRRLPQPVLDHLMQNPDTLTDVLRYHIVTGRIRSSQLKAGMAPTTLQGENLKVERNNRRFRLNGTNLADTDIVATNGVIHALDTVLLPPSLRQRLVALRLLAGDGRAQNLAGGTPNMGGRQITRDNATGLGGQAGSPVPEMANDLLAVAVGRSRRFSTFTRLINDSHLTAQLQSRGPYTVLIPVDDAWNRLPQSALRGLMADRELLRDVLTYHIVPGRVMTSELKSGNTRSLSGDGINVRAGRGAAKFNDAILLEHDIPANNGVIHAINRVLLPQRVIDVLASRGIMIGGG